MARRLKSGCIQLGAQRVDVRIVDDLYTREVLCGDAIFNENVIRLAGDVANTQAVDTLLHEIVHFLLFGSPFPDKDGEYVAGILARGLASLFRDNPEWVETISGIFREEAKCQTKSTRKQTTRGTQTRKPRHKRRAARRT